MPLATFAAGPYTATFNTDNAPGSPAGKGAGVRDLGLVEGVRRWQRSIDVVPVLASAFGQAVIDDVYQGGQCFVSMTFKEWTPAVKDALWPFGETFGELGAAGRLLSSLAGELVLTAVADTPAAANGPATLTFGKAIIAPQQTQVIPLGDEERDIVVVFRCYPYLNSGGKVVWFDET